jgi:ribonuclease HI
MSETGVFTIHTDGAARGNPGPAAYAFVIERSGETVAEEHGCLGDTTNNVAEYTALIKALTRAGQLGSRRLDINSDSELMVKQMRGEYKVKNAGLLLLFEEAKDLVAGFEQVKFHHVRREQNRRADALCNEALDGAPKPERKPIVKAPAAKAAAPQPVASSSGLHKAAALPAHAREEILECLRAVACVWAEGNPNHPRAEEVWDQLWFILEESGVLKQGKTS